MAKRRNPPSESPDLVVRDGALALTFVNQGSRRSPRLGSYAELLDWAVRHDAITSADATGLRQLAGDREDDASAVFATAEEMHAILSRLVNGAVDRQAPPPADVERLNELFVTATPRRTLVPYKIRLDWDWQAEPEPNLYRPLWDVARSAWELLTSSDVARVKRCAAESCDVVFLPDGRGHPRKWCNMLSCGAPDRSRRHYQQVTKPYKEEEKRREARERAKVMARFSKG